MNTRTQDAPGVYVWAPAGKNFHVHLELDVLERLQAEVLRGFGAVPKRGAEVGGVLLGQIEEDGDQTTIHIENFESVVCGYKRGPSYLLTDDEAAAFSQTVSIWKKDSSKPIYAVGYFRSHTRDGLNLAPEDIALMNQYFPDAGDVALLIRPNATKASLAGFFVREDGVFPETTPLEFPFRRWELTGEEPPAPRALTDRRRDRIGPELVRGGRKADGSLPPPINPPGSFIEEPPVHFPRETAASVAPPAFTQTEPAKPEKKVRWMWLPLSFMFLLLGVVLGFQSALFVGPKVTGVANMQDFALSLNIQKSGSNLTVRWNRNAPAIHAGQRGVLEIEDGEGSPQPVDLDLAHLESGSMIYRSLSKSVHFKLIIYETSRITVTETADWQE
jgi:hypothetical protein